MLTKLRILLLQSQYCTRSSTHPLTHPLSPVRLFPIDKQLITKVCSVCRGQRALEWKDSLISPFGCSSFTPPVEWYTGAWPSHVAHLHTAACTPSRLSHAVLVMRAGGSELESREKLQGYVGPWRVPCLLCSVL